MILYWWFSYKY